MSSSKLIFLFSFFIISNCSFQTSIFNELNKQSNGKNLVLSPISIFQILSLTSNGAKGTTQEEMLETLQNSNDISLNSINYNLLKVLKNFTTLEIANAVMTKVNPEKKFTEICNNYLALITKLETAEQVNNWCSQKTHGKINKKNNEIPEDVKMILLNAVYFKGLWESEFTKKQTKLKSFYNLNKNEVKVETMYKLGFFNYYEGDDIQAVEIPYKKDKMSAVIILPKKELDINTWINKISNNQNNLNSIINKLSFQRVHLELPKFKFEYLVELKETLQNLGMSTAFTDNADFNELSQKEDLKIDSVIQKSLIKVDEEGTEAAAVTMVRVSVKKSAGPIRRKEIIRIMKVNRPFLFLIKSSLLPEDYNLLFMAKIEKLK